MRFHHLPFDVLLASASPRRKELLKEVIDDFEVFPCDIDEEILYPRDPWKTAMHIATQKALYAKRKRLDPMVIIAGDTIVAIPDGDGFKQLGKPKDEQDAFDMLRSLSGRSHLVITGLAIHWYRKHERCGSETTTVHFRDLSDEQIWAYVKTGEPMDKAGAYAIQGGAADFVTHIEGSYSNVVGLPLEELRILLMKDFPQ